MSLVLKETRSGLVHLTSMFCTLDVMSSDVVDSKAGMATREVNQWQIQDFTEEGHQSRGAPTYDFAKFFQKLH